MAITSTDSAQLGNDTDANPRKYPVDDHGKMRFLYGKVTQGAAAGDDGSFVNFFYLPSGRIRILPDHSRVKCSALGASRVLKIGHAAYYNAGLPTDVAATAADDDAIGVGVDVSAAAVKVAQGTLLNVKFDVYSRGGILIYGTVTGGTIPAAATLELLLAYIAE